MDKKISCSELPRKGTCPGSASPKIAIHTSGKWGEAGTRSHELFAQYITGGNPDPDEADVETFDETVELWDKMGITGDVDSEFGLSAQIDGYTISGTLDAGCWGGTMVIDLKTGRGTTSAYLQLVGYAVLYGLHHNLPLDQIQKLVVINPTLKQVITWEITHGEALYRIREVIKGIEEWDGKTYQMGDHCTYCPGRYHCPASLGTLQKSAVICQSIFAVPDFLASAEDADLVELYRAFSPMRKTIDDAEKLIKGMVEARGELKGEEGKLWIKKSSREAIVVGPAYSWLEEQFGEGIRHFMKLGMGNLKTLVDARIMGVTIPDWMKKVETSETTTLTYTEHNI